MPLSVSPSPATAAAPTTTNNATSPARGDGWQQLFRSQSARRPSVAVPGLAGHSHRKDNPAEVEEDLRRQLSERDQDLALAAEIGQSLVLQVDALQARVQALEAQQYPDHREQEQEPPPTPFTNPHEQQETETQAQPPQERHLSPCVFEGVGWTPTKQHQKQQERTKLETPAHRRRRQLQLQKDLGLCESPVAAPPPHHNSISVETQTHSFELGQDSGQASVVIQQLRQQIVNLQQAHRSSDDRMWDLELLLQSKTEENQQLRMRAEKALQHVAALQAENRKLVEQWENGSGRASPAKHRLRLGKKQQVEGRPRSTPSPVGSTRTDATTSPAKSADSPSKILEERMQALQAQHAAQMEKQKGEFQLQLEHWKEMFQSAQEETRQLSRQLQDTQDRLEELAPSLSSASVFVGNSIDEEERMLAERLEREQEEEQQKMEEERVRQESLVAVRQDMRVMVESMVAHIPEHVGVQTDVSLTAASTRWHIVERKLGSDQHVMAHVMIGMWAFKFKSANNSTGAKKKRYLWLDPWLRRVYWSKKQPTNGHSVKVKASLPIASFQLVNTDNHGLVLHESGASPRDLHFAFSSMQDANIWAQAMEKCMDGFCTVLVDGN